MWSSIITLYEKAIDNFKQNLEYLKWKIPFSLISKGSKIYGIIKQMEANAFFSPISGFFRELVAASYLIAIEDKLLMTTPMEFAEDISIYIGIIKKDVLILGNNTMQFITEILQPIFESFFLTFQMTCRLIRFIATHIKMKEKYKSLKALTLTDFLVPTLQKIQDMLQTTDVRLAATLMQVGMTEFLNQHNCILEGKPLRISMIKKAYRMAIEEYPSMEGDDIFFDISWRLIFTKTWYLILIHLEKKMNLIPKYRPNDCDKQTETSFFECKH
ncbi:MAG: hypothetical protein ACFFCW_05435 [Candidatus Hodarchaeota archaeon]